MRFEEKPFKMQAPRAIRYRWAPTILAVLATFLAAPPTRAADVRLQQLNERVVEISGGSGREAWKLRYGKLLGSEYKPLLVPAKGNRAWYAYGGWLRLIDTQKGEVLGRWHFPTVISNLSPQGTTVDVEITEKVWGWIPKGNEAEGIERYLTRRVQLDPANPHVPFWPDGNLMRYRIPYYEAANVPGMNIGNVPNLPQIPAEEAKKDLPELKEMTRRDRFTPWFGIALGKVLMAIGDPRAAKVFQEAINSPGADFTELLPISAYLDNLEERELARAAFDRGYQDFWTKGNDPRLFVGLIGQLMLYRPPANKVGDPSTELGREFVERMYRLMPYGEGADSAWRLYADYWGEKGQNDETRLWQARYEDARRNGGFNGWGAESRTISLDRNLLLVPAAFLALAVYWLVLFIRYRPQRRLDKAIGQRSGRSIKGFVFFNAQYWSRAERFSFFIIAFVLWGAVGLGGQYWQFVLRRAAGPIGVGMGNFGGPSSVNRLETDWLPSSPYRDLLLAYAYQQDGQLEKAERLYRTLPQFAESWNNLGVIFKNAGKDDQAKQAFEKALQLDPALTEAELNLGRPPTDLWTEMHQNYLPGQPMLAPPRGTLWDRAFLGGSPAIVYLRALLGPFSVQDPAGLFGLARKVMGQEASMWLTGAALVFLAFSLASSGAAVVALAFSLALLLILPQRDMTQQPGKWQFALELLASGTSPRWGILGGFVLVLWVYFLVQGYLLFDLGTPYVLAADSIPNITSAYGVPGEVPDVYKIINPTWLWLYLAPAVLFAVNLVLLFRDKLFRKTM